MPAPPFDPRTQARPPSNPAVGTSLADQLRSVAVTWNRSQYELVVLADRFASSHEWVLAGCSSPATFVADVAEVEVCTAREWLRIGKLLHDLPVISSAFETGDISYSKVRQLTRIATADNEAELLAEARHVPASELGRVLARWTAQNLGPEELEALQHRARSVKWRTEADGMVTFTLRLAPLVAAMLIAVIDLLVMRRSHLRRSTDEVWPSLAQQRADAVAELVGDRDRRDPAGREAAGKGEPAADSREPGASAAVETEIVIHVRGDGTTMDDGTPIPASVVERVAPVSFIRALIHDVSGRPIDATNRRRHPTTRQKRLVTERDRRCVDCRRTDLLEYDHVPDFERTGHTVTSELVLRCATCHRTRHARPRSSTAAANG